MPNFYESKPVFNKQKALDWIHKTYPDAWVSDDGHVVAVCEKWPKENILGTGWTEEEALADAVSKMV